MFTKTQPLFILGVFGAFILFLGVPNNASGATVDQFNASMDGSQEVPPVDTNGIGAASLQLKGDTITYQVNVVDTDKVNQIHIHQGANGEDGQVLVTLYSSDEHQDALSLADKFKEKIDVASDNVQRSSQFSSSGNFQASDLQGPLAGKTLEDLVSLMQSGQTYVNVHTTGYPDGEIRGQINTG